MTEVWVELLGFSDASQTIAIWCWIVWLGAWTWGLADFHEGRLRPR